MKEYISKLYNYLYLKYWKFFDALPIVFFALLFAGFGILVVYLYESEPDSQQIGVIVDRKAFHTDDAPSGVAIFVQIETEEVFRIVRSYFPSDYIIGKQICIQVLRGKFSPRRWAVLPLLGKCDANNNAP